MQPPYCSCDPNVSAVQYNTVWLMEILNHQSTSGMFQFTESEVCGQQVNSCVFVHSKVCTHMITKKSISGHIHALYAKRHTEWFVLTVQVSLIHVPQKKPRSGHHTHTHTGIQMHIHATSQTRAQTERKNVQSVCEGVWGHSWLLVVSYSTNHKRWIIVCHLKVL